MKIKNSLCLMKQVHFFTFINLIGFGTSPFLNYSYAPIGEKALKHTPKLPKNVTVCATISTNKVELLRFFSEGGTKKEVFEEYFLFLVKHLTNQYPKKTLVIVMDNLWAHKCHLVIRIMEYYPKIRVLFTPSCTSM